MMDTLLTGSVAYDYLMTFPGHFREHLLPDRLEKVSLSFLVDSMSRQRGGVAANIGYTMALLGQRPRLMATVGEDFSDYRAWLEAAGVDTSLLKVIPSEFTASFFATTDQSAAQIASFYPGAMASSASQSLHEVHPRPDIVVVSPSAPDAMAKFSAECRQLGIPFLFDPSQQILRLSGEELARDMAGAKFLFCNDYEYDLVLMKTGLSQEQILDLVDVLVVTRGKGGAFLFVGDTECFIPTVPEQEIVDPTGVGDAFRGGFLVGHAHGFDWTLCGEVGSLAAVYCLEQRGPQGHRYTPDEFVARFRKHFDDAGRLDILLERPKAEIVGRRRAKGSGSTSRK